MAEPGDVTVKTYRGNCHCGSFVFEVEAPEVTEVTSCNCSICAKKGYLWIYPKAPVKVIKGEGSLTGYSFGEKKVVHEVSSLYFQAIFPMIHINECDSTFFLLAVVVLPNLRYHPRRAGRDVPGSKDGCPECESYTSIPSTIRHMEASSLVI